MSRLNKGIIYTNSNCIGCNKCISKCPVMGANVLVRKKNKNQIFVDDSKCIRCGKCLDACVHNAREYRDDTIRFIEALNMGEQISLVVAPSFYVAYKDKASNILGYLKHLGVKKIYNASYGADICTWANIKYREKHKDEKKIISSNCPVAVSYIEKNIPELVDKLIPVLSPVVCLAVYVKKYLNDTNEIAFLSPCIAKYDEIHSKDISGYIEYSITFDHMFRYFTDHNVVGYNAVPDIDDFSLGSVYAYPNGLKENIEYFTGKDNIVWKFDKTESFFSELENLQKDYDSFCDDIYMIDTMSCSGGCIEGPANGLEKLEKKQIFLNYKDLTNKDLLKDDYQNQSYSQIHETRLKKLNEEFSNLDLNDFMRTFENKYEKEIPLPEDTVNEIFTLMNKNTYALRNINCQSCGYDSCEMMVKAIAYGYSNMENCIYYSKYKNMKLLMTDNITGIPNENAFIYFLNDKIFEKSIGKYSAIRLKIKNFTLINERFGTEAGDRVIFDFCKNLSDIVDEEEIVARIGGNNYLIAVYKNNLQKVLDKLNNIIVLIHQSSIQTEYKISVKAGIYQISKDDYTASEIMNKVSIAFANVSKSESCDFIYYDENIRKQMYDEMMIRRMIPNALDTKQFVIYYQPKVSTENKTMVGAEALVRWKIDNEIIYPGKFIPICEKNGLVKQIDFYVLECICRKLREWLDNGIDVVKISSNFSKQHFEEEGVAQHIEQIIDKYHIPHEYIEVEFTETAYIERQDILIQTIDYLKKIGITSSMDDFGSGYSSLGLLQSLNFDVLKLDKSLLGKSILDIKTQKIIKSIIKMAKDLKLEIIAEGVETKEEFEMLRELDCDIIQGFLFDKPLEENKFLKRLLNKVYL